MAVVAGAGGVLKIGANVVVGVVDFNWTEKVTSVDTTNLTSTRVTSRPGLPDQNEATFTIQYDFTETTHATISGLTNSPSIEDFTFTESNGVVNTFSGYVTNVAHSGYTYDGNAQADVDVTMTTEVSKTGPGS